MAQAAGEMLGASVRVRTEAFPDDHPEVVPPPPDGERSAMLSWDSPRHEHARLRLCRAADDCLERWVAFEQNDPELERGRTLGFLAAAVFLETQESPAAAPPAATPTPLPVAPPSKPSQGPLAAVFPRGEISAAVAVSGPGDGTTLGASLGVDYAWSRKFRAGLAGELRFGDLPEAQASSRIGSLVVHTVFVALEPSTNTWLGVGAGAGLYQLSNSHFSSDDPEPDRQRRFLFGGTLSALGGIDFNKTSGIYLELAAELLSGRTTIYVHEEPVATWPIFNPLARLGLRAGF